MELRSFLSLFNFFCRSVLNFVRIAAPLNGKLRKNQAHVYTELSDQELKALETIQEKLMSPLIPALLRSQGPYTVETDTLGRRIGCGPLQEHPGAHKYPIGS